MNALRLRPPRADDVDDVLAYASEAGFFQYVEVPERLRRDYRREDAEAHLGELEANAAAGHPAWALELEGRVVGMVRFRAGAGGLPELGYGVAAAHRGRGLATHAVQEALAWADGRWSETEARCHRENRASLRVLEKVGYVEARRMGAWVVLRRRVGGSSPPTRPAP